MIFEASKRQEEQRWAKTYHKKYSKTGPVVPQGLEHRLKSQTTGFDLRTSSRAGATGKGREGVILSILDTWKLRSCFMVPKYRKKGSGGIRHGNNWTSRGHGEGEGRGYSKYLGYLEATKLFYGAKISRKRVWGIPSWEKMNEPGPRGRVGKGLF